jgi:hypothetical protein
LSAVELRDPGPLGRLEYVIEQADTMAIVVQRLSGGETLKEIAKAWEVPYGRFAQWIVEDRGRSEQYNGALKIWADSLAQECVAIADEQGEVSKRDGTSYDPDVPRDKLRIETRLKLAGKWDRSRYGEATEVKHTGSVSLVAILSSMPRGQVVDVTPPALEAPESETAVSSQDEWII